jgi:hypothetical protein
MEIHQTTRMEPGMHGAPPVKPHQRRVVPTSRDEKRLLKAARNLLMRIGS